MPPSRPGKYDRNNPNTGPPQPSDYPSRKDYDDAELDMFHLTCERLLGNERYTDLVKAGSRSPDPDPPKVQWKRRWPSEDARDSASVSRADHSDHNSPQTRSTPPSSTAMSSPAHSSEHERARSVDSRPLANGSDSFSSNHRPQSVLSVASLLSTDDSSAASAHAARPSKDTRSHTADQPPFATQITTHDQSTSDPWT